MPLPPPPPGFVLDTQGAGRPIFQQRPPQPSPQTAPQRRKDELDVIRAPAQIRNDQLGASEKEQSIRFAPTKHGMEIVDRFRTDPAVKAYRETLPAVISMTQARPGGEGDLTVIYSWARSMDPLGSVREGDTQLAGSASSIWQRAETMANNVKAGNLLAPEQRIGLIEEARNRARQLNQSYSQTYQQYADFARRSGLDPAILGPHEGDKFRTFEEAYVRKHNPKPRGGEGLGDIGFNAPDAPKNPLSAEQQSAYDAFLRTNPKATPEQLMGFTRMIGGELDPTRAGEIIEHYRRFGKFAPGSEAVQPKPDISQIRKGDEVVDPILRGLADTATLGFSEELAAGVDTLAGAAPYGQRLDFHNAVRDHDKEKNFGKRLVGQLGGGVALPTGGVNTIRGLAGVGAGYGGAYGVGSTDGGIGQRAVGGALGAGAGGAIGAGLGAAIPGLARGAAGIGRRMVGPATPEQQALLRAGAQEKVPVNMADLFPGSRNTVSTLETIPGASGPIRRGIQGGADALESRVAALGRGGQVRNEGPLGERIYKAGERYISGHKKQAEADYGVARRLGGSVKAEPRKAAIVTRDTIAKLAETPNMNRSTLGLHRDILGDFLDDAGNLKPLSIDAIKGMRRSIRQEMSSRGLVGSQEDADLQAVVQAASDDMFDALKAHDPRAAAAFKKADDGYAQRSEYIKQVLQPIMGSRDKPVSGEALVAKLRGMAGSGARGSTRQLNRFMQTLNPEERADVAASLAAGMGRRSADEPFSPNLFVSSARNLDERARIVFFGREGARSIKNLTRLAEAKKETIGRLNNSRSGQVFNYRTVISNLLLGVPGGGALAGAAIGIGGPTTAAIGLGASGALLGASRVMSKALMNEQFTRLLANAPATANPKAIDAHFGQLRKLAAKDPNVRSVVENLERQLLRAANENNVPRAAADSGRDDEPHR